MMRTPNAYAIAVRKADGTIVNTAARLPKWSDKFPLLKLPVLRGGAVLDGHSEGVAVLLMAHWCVGLKRRPIGNPVAALGDTDGASAAKF